MSKQHIIIGAVIAATVVGAGAFFLYLQFFSDQGTYTPSTREEADPRLSYFIMSAEIISEPNQTVGDAYVTLNGQDSKLILESNEQTGETYDLITVSPNQNFAAVQGYAAGEPFVTVYEVRTDILQERITGTLNGWTTDGKLRVTMCDIPDIEGCIENTSENSKIPWVMTEITTEDDSLLGDAPLLPSSDFITNINRIPSLTTLAQLIKAGGRFIDGTGPFTILAPTNDALANITATSSSVSELLKTENRDQLRAFLRSHVIVDNLTADQLVNQSPLTSAENQSLNVTTNASSTVIINDSAQILIPDLESSNGTIHLIDTALLVD